MKCHSLTAGALWLLAACGKGKGLAGAATEGRLYCAGYCRRLASPCAVPATRDTARHFTFNQFIINRQPVIAQ